MTTLRDIANETLNHRTTKKTLVKKNVNTQDIINEILEEDKASWRDTDEFAARLVDSIGNAKLYTLWRFLRREIKYKADTIGTEVVKSPVALWKYQKGDCKSLSIFIGSVLSTLGIPYSYRFVSWSAKENYTHVYVVAHTDDGDIIIDAVHHTYDDEAPYHRKKDVRIQERVAVKVAGIQYPVFVISDHFKKALFFLTGGFLIYKLLKS